MNPQIKQTVAIIGSIAASICVCAPVIGLTILAVILHDGETTRELVSALTGIIPWGLAGLFLLAGVDVLPRLPQLLPNAQPQQPQQAETAAVDAGGGAESQPEG